MESHDVVDPIARQVKMVIWDLDDTFWRGTLSEGGIEPISDNAAIVGELSGRGIVSSICSRNDFDAAAAELRKLGLWNCFVFPEIQWESKGPSVQKIIEAAKLRAENVLFIDDHPANRAEVEYHNPGIMCLDGSVELSELLQHEHLKGSPDPDFSRLQHYKVLEQKQTVQTAQGLSNVEFLRQSHIRVRIDYHIEDYMDRIVELVNRANQLNFTKSRFQSEQELAEFKRQLGRFGFKAGVVLVQDDYGDYGVAGFFMLWRAYKSGGITSWLAHFVFSCRVMNMGIEQYVYERLGRPEITVKPPVANEICPFPQVDWITEGSDDEHRTLFHLRDRRLLLLGNCELLQIGSYCSSNCIEFIGRPCGDCSVRYDDPFFVLSNPHTVEASRAMKRLPIWNADEMRQFDREVRQADALVFQWYASLTDTFFRLENEIVIRLHPGNLELILKSELGSWFVRNCTYMNFSLSERLAKLRQAMASIMERCKPDAKVFLLGQSVEGTGYGEAERDKRRQYKAMLVALSHSDPRIHFIDPDRLSKPEWRVDGWHFTRQAYFEFAKHIGTILDQVTISAESDAPISEPFRTVVVSGFA